MNWQKIVKDAKVALSRASHGKSPVRVLVPWHEIVTSGDMEVIIEVEGFKLRLLDIAGYDYGRPHLVRIDTPDGETVGQRRVNYEIPRPEWRRLGVVIATAAQVMEQAR